MERSNPNLFEEAAYTSLIFQKMKPFVQSCVLWRSRLVVEEMRVTDGLNPRNWRVPPKGLFEDLYNLTNCRRCVSYRAMAWEVWKIVKKVAPKMGSYP